MHELRDLLVLKHVLSVFRFPVFRCYPSVPTGCRTKLEVDNTNNLEI
jgi:hypothetical protein